MGRKPKYYVMTNGKVAKELLFTFVPEETIPNKEVNRFLQLCDYTLLDLGNLEEITYTDIDAVAQYNQLRLFKDMICKFMSDPDMEMTHSTMIIQLEKLCKQMGDHVENLKTRRKDRIVGKTDSNQKSFSDLAHELDSEPDRINKLKKKSKKELESFIEENPDSDPLEFMDNMSSSEDY